MRLICGIFQLNGAPADESLLRAMMAQMDMSHLAPASVVWRDGPVAFGVLEFGGRAPLAMSLQGGAVMAADARLDEPRGGDAAADANLLHRKFADGALAQVLGDFAFARWDAGTQTLTCGRDGFGIRPFSYVYKPGELFAFASLPQALHGGGVVPAVLDEAALVRRVLRVLQTDDSLVVGIKRLPPAHLLEVTAGNLGLSRYWQMDRAAVGTRDCTPQFAAAELRRLVEQAVACRLPPGEIGAHLSGGLDSSSLAVIAARRLREEGRTLHAYSFLDRQRNDIKLEDETDFVRAVLDQEKDIDWMPVRPVANAPLSPASNIDKMYSLDADAPENQVCTRAQAQGVHLLLSGWGGDEAATFNSRGAMAEHFLHGRWRLLAREAKALSKERGWSLPKVLYADVVGYLIPDGVKRAAKRLVGKKQLTFGAALTPAALRLATDDNKLSMVPDGRENRWRLIHGAHISERCEVWAMIGARHGLAFAFPLLDRRVVEFALSLPSALFLRGGFRRRPFRDAMHDVLPQKVRQRHAKYQSFPGGVIDMAERKAEFAARIDVFEKSAIVRRMVDLAELRRKLDACPSADALRAEMSKSDDNPTASPLIAEVRQGFGVAEYLLRHGGAN